MGDISGIKQPSQRRNSSNLTFNLTAIVLALVFVGVGIAYLIDGLGRQESASPTATVAGPAVYKVIGGDRLAIPTSWFRFAEQREEEFSDRVDLLFALPIGDGGRQIEIEVSLQPRSRVRTSAQLLDAVYLHQFKSEQIGGPRGLVGKPLNSAEGFQNETVWYDPLSIDPFVAKCIAPIAGSIGGTCLRTVNVSEHVSATYLFGREALANWREFDAAATTWLAKIDGI